MKDFEKCLQEGISLAQAKNHDAAMIKYEKAADLYAKYIMSVKVTPELRKLGTTIHYHWGISISYLDKQNQVCNSE